MGFVSGKDWRTPHVVKADPWAKLHAWRFNGPISKGQNIKVPFFFLRSLSLVLKKRIKQHLFPGLGIAIVAFTVYCAADLD